MGQIRQILALAFHYRFRAVAIIVFNILYTVFNILSLVLFVPFLQIIFPSGDGPKEYEPTQGGNVFDRMADWYNGMMHEYVQTHGEEAALLFVCISVGVAFLLKNLSRYGAIYHMSYMRMAAVRDIRKKLFDKALRLPMAFYTEEKKGDLLARMTTDVNEIEVSVLSILDLLFRDPLMIVIMLGVLFYWSPELTLFSLILLPISAGVISLLTKKIKKNSDRGQRMMGHLQTTMEETLGGIRIIKAFSAEKLISDKFDKENREHRRILTRTFRRKDAASPLNEFLGAIVMVGLVFYGGHLVLDGNLEGQQFFGFIILFSQLLRPVQGVAHAMGCLARGQASIERINHILDADERIGDAPQAKDIEGFQNGIEFKGIGFSYDQVPVIKELDLSIPKGSTVALVGESGSGKSTLADLLLRFYDVGRGSIEIDGEDIRHIRIRSLRGLYGVVSQDPILFNDSVRSNLLLAKPDATDQELEHALRVANAWGFVNELENGMDTPIGDSGNRLSGGQKQRLSIARAILKNPPILILDEATSALDTESERSVQEALNRIMEDRTALVIAHRLSTIRGADRIIVLREGEVVETGNHETLLEKKGHYYRYWQAQTHVH